MSGTWYTEETTRRKLPWAHSNSCWKCRDGRTRAHHRLCSKRGGKASALDQMRDAEAAYCAMTAGQAEEDNRVWDHVLDIP